MGESQTIYSACFSSIIPCHQGSVLWNKRPRGTHMVCRQIQTQTTCPAWRPFTDPTGQMPRGGFPVRWSNAPSLGIAIQPLIRLARVSPYSLYSSPAFAV
jgi:hypothetical protein